MSTESVTVEDVTRLGFSIEKRSHETAGNGDTWLVKDRIRVILTESTIEVYEFVDARRFTVASMQTFSTSTAKGPVLSFLIALHGGG